MPLTVIVLAAGASRRLGHPKQLVERDGETLLARASRIAHEVGKTIVVTRREFASLVPDAIVNELPDEGIASSIRLGVAACSGAVLLMLCDQPLISAEHLRKLIDAKAPIAATAYSGTLGVPAFFASEFRDELLALRGDSGAKSVIERHREVVVGVAFEGAAIDVD